MRTKLLTSLAFLLLGPAPALADDPPSPAKSSEEEGGKPEETKAESAEEEEEGPVTGGVELVTQYVQRGMTSGPDHDSTALQPWVEVELPLGFVFNYWGSNTTYPSPGVSKLQEDCEGEEQCLIGRPRAFENDLTLWWQLDLGEVNLRIGATYFVFMNARENDVLESNILLSMTPKIASVDLGELSIGAETMLDDAAWGNRGDTYLLIRHEREIAGGFGAAVDLGLHGYAKGEGEDALTTTESFNFRHLDLTLYHEVAKTSLRLRGTLTLGGKDREGIEQPMTLTWGAGWSF